jgi:hypothetical protein
MGSRVKRVVVAEKGRGGEGRGGERRGKLIIGSKWEFELRKLSLELLFIYVHHTQ